MTNFQINHVDVLRGQLMKWNFSSDLKKPVPSLIPPKKNKLGTNETEVDKN
jgi:hypothetical protein